MWLSQLCLFCLLCPLAVKSARALETPDHLLDLSGFSDDACDTKPGESFMLQDAQAQSGASQQEPSSPSHTQSGMTNMQNMPTKAGDQMASLPKDWPSPVNDSRRHAFLLFDNLENEAGNSPNALRYAFQGWYGGDYNRLWINSEGRQNTGNGQGGIELQTLYGRLISPFFDFQAGLRVDNLHGGNLNASRVFGVVGLQGISPYRFNVQPLLFVDQKGNVSFRFEGTYDLLLTQRLILQPRIEMNFAIQDVPRFEIGSGLSDVEVGGRLRYEIRREFAPYIGISYSQSYGGTAAYARRAGENVQSLSFVAGIRFWWQSFRRFN